MSRKCQLTGRGPQAGNRVSHAHNVTHRVFNINLQRVRVLINGRVMRIRVSANAIKSGLIVRPPIVLKERTKRIFEVAPAVVRIGLDSATQKPIDESEEEYFMNRSVVSRIFKPKPKPPEENTGVLSEDDLAQLAADFDTQRDEERQAKRASKYKSKHPQR